jgi:hypothetical protein
MVSKHVLRGLGGCLFALALLASPVLATDVVTSGADVWKTSEAASYSSFAADPIPADFFCPGSKPFSGSIAMKGAPIATDPPGVLGSSDTVVHRLDDATFDADGVATTRIQLMALSLVGTEPLEVGCAQPYTVAATLAGEQPVTEMRIVRESADGGTFAAPLALNVKLVFTPANGDGRSLALQREVRLAPAPGSYWTTTDKIGTNVYGEGVRVDTDGDGIPESTMPKPSNFVAGMALAAVSGEINCPPGWYATRCCHCTPWSENPTWETEPVNDCAHLHCTDCCKPCSVVPDSGPAAACVSTESI